MVADRGAGVGRHGRPGVRGVRVDAAPLWLWAAWSLCAAGCVTVWSDGWVTECALTPTLWDFATAYDPDTLVVDARPPLRPRRPGPEHGLVDRADRAGVVDDERQLVAVGRVRRDRRRPRATRRRRRAWALWARAACAAGWVTAWFACAAGWVTVWAADGWVTAWADGVAVLAPARLAERVEVGVARVQARPGTRPR